MYEGYYGIDKAYKIVQTILNENHYGTLSPTRFNVLAYKAQQSVFSEAINFIKKLRYKELRRGAGLDKVRLYKEAIHQLYESNVVLETSSISVLDSTKNVFYKESDIAYVDDAICKNINGEWRRLEIVPVNSNIGFSGHMLSPTQAYPIAIDTGDYYEPVPNDVTNMRLSYYRKPGAPKWTYVTSNNQPVFNPSDSNIKDFEVGEELLDDMILDILQSAGMHLQRQDVVQYSQNKESYTDKQEMQ